MPQPLFFPALFLSSLSLWFSLSCPWTLCFFILLASFLLFVLCLFQASFPAFPPPWPSLSIPRAQCLQLFAYFVNAGSLSLPLSSGPEFTWADVMSVIFHLILSSFSAGLLKSAQLPVTLTASGVLLASVNPSPFPRGASVCTCSLGICLLFGFLPADFSPHSSGYQQSALPTSQ